MNTNNQKKVGAKMSENEFEWYGPETSTFGDRVCAAREQSGMTQKQLAKRLGVKHSTIISWEQDLSEPRANRLSMLSGILNVSFSWLLTGEGEGIESPEDQTQLSPEISDILIEIRDLKASLVKSADRLGRLEKKLRTKLKES